MFTKAIVRPPSRNFAQGLTTAALGSPDYHLALEQHAAYCAALEQCGLQLIRLEADEQFPDSCFVEDVALIFGKPHASTRHAVLTRPGAASRLGEVDGIRDELERLFSPLDEIRLPGTVDGGDVCEAGEHFFVGISERTSEEGASQLGELLMRRGFTTTFVDIRSASGLLHLKSGLAYLTANTLVIIEALAHREEFHGYDLIRVAPEEAYAANCIEVNGRVLIAAGHPRIENKLRELGYEIIALDMSEFEKMDGGLSCLSLRW